MSASAWCNVFTSLQTLSDKLSLRSVSKEFYLKYSRIESLVTQQELDASDFLFEQRGNTVAEIPYETQRSLLCLLHLKQCIDRGISTSLYTTDAIKYSWLLSSLSMNEYSSYVGRGRGLFSADRIIYDAPSHINDQLIERLTMKLDSSATDSIFKDKTKELIIVKYCGLTELYRFTLAKFIPMYSIHSRHVSVMLDMVFGGIREIVNKLNVDRIYTLGVELSTEGVTIPIVKVDYFKRKDYNYKQDDCIMFYFCTVKQRGRKLEIYKFLSDLNSQLRVAGKRLVFVVCRNDKSSDSHFAMNMLIPEHERSILQTTKYEDLIENYNYAKIPQEKVTCKIVPSKKRKRTSDEFSLLKRPSRSWQETKEKFDLDELESCLSLNTSWECENFDSYLFPYTETCKDPFEEVYIQGL